MYCNSCNALIPDNASHCPYCGAACGRPVAAPTYGYAATPSVPPKSVLTMGILSIAFACTFYFAFLGIIFGAIGKSKANRYMAEGGQLAGSVKVGRILANVGFILGIVFCALVFFVIIAALAG